MLPLPTNARSALLIVDMQNFFFRDPERRRNLETVIQNINALISHFDNHSFPVVNVLTAYNADGSDWDLKMKASGKPELIEGTAEADLLPGITISKNHLNVVKTRYSAFFKTTLAETLDSAQVNRAVVVGGYTHYCVNATVFDAYCHDFVPCIITDAVLSHLPEESEVMINRMKRNGYHVFTTQEFLRSESSE